MNPSVQFNKKLFIGPVRQSWVGVEVGIKHSKYTWSL